MIDGRAIVLSRNLLYTDVVGRDACGIGGVASREGKASHEVVKKALLALCNMEHRGGVCGQSGDGAGLTFQLPRAFFREEAKRLRFDGARLLKPEDRLAVGVFFFLDPDAQRRDRACALIQQTLEGGPFHRLGWRDVPTNDDVPPPESLACRPLIRQLIGKVQSVQSCWRAR